jgi:hypothetical protein
MKVYTFNADRNTSVELLYSLRSEGRDSFFQQFIDRSSWQEVKKIQDCDVAIFPHKAFHPESLQRNDLCFAAVQTAKAYNKPIIVDAASDSDVPLDLPSAQVLRFGIYRTLQKPYETERPYWFPHYTYQALSSLPIHPPQQPIVGFCGTTASEGKWFKVGRALPLAISKKLLSQGKYAQPVDIRIKKGMSHSLRAKCLDILAKDSRVKDNFDVTNQLQDYYNPANSNRKLLEQKFVANMGDCLYNLCVRANGNYTSRFFMTLIAGRIPLVLDTDCVFPWEEKVHMVKVPVQALDRIGDFVIQHFESFSDRALMEMQQENREVYQKYMVPHKFIPNFVESVIDRPLVPLNI